MTKLCEGQTHTFQRTFTPDDVRQFAEVSGDQQPRHLQPDEEGRLIVDDLLMATMASKIGGDLGVFERSMAFDFHVPVYTGATVTCELVVESVEESAKRYDLSASVTCENEADNVVMSGTVKGVVWK